MGGGGLQCGKKTIKATTQKPAAVIATRLVITPNDGNCWPLACRDHHQCKPKSTTKVGPKRNATNFIFIASPLNAPNTKQFRDVGAANVRELHHNVAA